MLTLLLALLIPFAHAYDVGDWPEEQLKTTAAQVLPPESTVVSATGIPLARAGRATGVILARHQQGEWQYVQVLTTWVQDGQTWVSGGWGAGGCDDAAVLGVLDLEGEGRLVLQDGWATDTPQQPAERPAKPVLVVLTRERYDDGIERVEALVLDIHDPAKPWQLARARAGSSIPIWDPRADMPVQRSLGVRVEQVYMIQGDQGPELHIVQRDVPTPDSRCLEPEPETRRLLFQEGRFVEQLPTTLHQPCP